MRQEFTSHISDLFVFKVILNSIIEVDWIDLTQLHEVYTNAVISQCLSVNITDGSTNLKELLILRNCLLKFTEVVEQYTSTIIGTALISGFSSSFACEGKNLIIFQALLSCNSIV